MTGSVLYRPQSLILSPTRELAAQTTKTIQAMGEFMKVRAHTCVGGTSLGEASTAQLVWSSQSPCASAAYFRPSQATIIIQ